MLSKVFGAVKTAVCEGSAWVRGHAVSLAVCAVTGVALATGIGVPDAFAQTGVTVPEFVSATDLSGVASSLTTAIKPVVLIVLSIVIGIAGFRLIWGFFRSMGR